MPTDPCPRCSACPVEFQSHLIVLSYARCLSPHMQERMKDFETDDARSKATLGNSMRVFPSKSLLVSKR
jgi:hypothetical protein